jgi:hypothetical protein
MPSHAVVDAEIITLGSKREPSENGDNMNEGGVQRPDKCMYRIKASINDTRSPSI